MVLIEFRVEQHEQTNARVEPCDKRDDDNDDDTNCDATVATDLVFGCFFDGWYTFGCVCVCGMNGDDYIARTEEKKRTNTH